MLFSFLTICPISFFILFYCFIFYTTDMNLLQALRSIKGACLSQN